MSFILNHSKFGQGPDLIILHGLFGSSANWRTVANALSTKFTVYALDARNHGNSPWSESMTYLEMADDVVRFLDHHNIKKAHLLGHSMGGKTAMTFALNHQHRVNRLVIADISAKSYAGTNTGVHERNIEAMQSLDLAGLSEGRKQAELILSAKLNESKPVLQFLLQNLIIKDKLANWRINLPIIKHSLNSIMGEIDTISKPTFDGSILFLYGNDSDYIQQHDHDSIRNIFPNATISGIENAGHWLHAEKPVEFTEKVKEFLT